MGEKCQLMRNLPKPVLSSINCDVLRDRWFASLFNWLSPLYQRSICWLVMRVLIYAVNSNL